MKTFSEVKRRIVPGLILTATNHIRPEASGQRTVTKVQGNGYYFNIAGRVHESGERAGQPERFWYEWKSAKACRIDGPNTVTFLSEPHGTPLVTLVFHDAANLLDDSTVPRDFPVQPLKEGEKAIARATCGTCARSWDDDKVTSMTPTPSARCPFEAFHDEEESDVEITFQNVTITLPIGTDARAAYAVLCAALGEIGAEWSTDTYTLSDSPDDERSASELWGDVEKKVSHG